ncbi:MAG: Ig-like domain-containing protein, partial [Flavobacteriaceae bacterium]
LFYNELSLNPSNYNKDIVSVSFDKVTTSNNSHTTAILGITVYGTPSESIPVTAIEVTAENNVDAEIATIGGTLQLIATITPTDATNQNVTWSVESGSDFVSVNANGLVTALANGTATVRATSVDNTAIYDEIEVTVNYVAPAIPVTAIEVTTENDVDAEIATIGGTLQLVATITPTDATNQEVIWSVESGSDFASVDEDGLVTALANGTATIRATSDENDTVFDEIEIIVSNQVEPVACSFFTLSVTGYNEDIIAEGTGGNATDKSTNSIDGNWYSDVFYAQDFVPLNPHSSASSAAAYGGGIPVNGTVSSAATIGLTYQFAPFDQNNGLILRNNTTNTGTLTLTTPVQAQRIYIALVSTEGTNSITAAVNFQDGTSEVFSGITATDWYQNTVQPNNVVNEIGRVARGGAGSLENNFTGLTQTGIYQHEIQLSTANFEKYVISVDFSQTPPANNWTTTAVFALSACGTAPEITPVTAIEITTENDVDAEIATIGGTLQLIATITPTDATNQNVTWSVVSGSAFVSVDADGLVTAIANGTATVRATSVDNTAIYDEIEVTVNYVAPVIPVTSIEVTTENDVDAEIATIGGTLQLVATITPTDATNQEVTWSVESGNDFVSVDTNGLVTALANGTATVRATSVDNTSIFDEIEVTVNYVEPAIPVTAIEVTTENDVEAEITVIGDTLQLIATITPENATNQEVIWSVESGSGFVSVDDNGLVTALSDGTATVRATSVENDAVFDEIEVVVNSLSIKDILAESIAVYPNPTNGILNIDSTSEIVLVEVYNLVGQKTASYKNISKVDFSTLPNGVYIVKIQTQEGKSIIRKITKSTF